jgi:uncharacterized protein (DUF1697 family)
MRTCIALFRGINVGGNNMIPMKDLRLIIEQQGCAEVRTYIQSGNAIFRTPLEDLSLLESRLTAAIARRYGFEPRVVVLTHKELERAAAANPFPEASAHPKNLHLFFLVDRPARPDLAGMQGLATPGERFALKGKTFYFYAPDGIGRSRLAARIDRHLGVQSTARNWRTVMTLIELAGGKCP